MKNISGTKRKKIFAKTNGRCAYCGRKLLSHRHWSTDHLTPLSKHGTGKLDNLVACCRSCNSKKGTRTLAEFRLFGEEQITRRVDLALRFLDRHFEWLCLVMEGGSRLERAKRTMAHYTRIRSLLRQARKEAQKIRLEFYMERVEAEISGDSQ